MERYTKMLDPKKENTIYNDKIAVVSKIFRCNPSTSYSNHLTIWLCNCKKIGNLSLLVIKEKDQGIIHLQRTRLHFKNNQNWKLGEIKMLSRDCDGCSQMKPCMKRYERVEKEMKVYCPDGTAHLVGGDSA